MRGLLACLCVLFASVVAFAQDPSKEITNSIGMRLVRIPKGTFMMGSPESEEGRRDDERLHEVTINNDFYLGVCEVTQAQYEEVRSVNPSFFQGDMVAGKSDDRPVETVTWLDAVAFCKSLSELPEEKKAGHEYRLPTEAEWEYACRAGTRSAFSFDDEGDFGLLTVYGWFRGNSGGTHTVGLREPNPWGLYDMHGNVWEWCSDRYGEYPQIAVVDPVGPEEGSRRVARGGSWSYDATYCRSAMRFRRIPSIPPDNLVGFRVALNSPDTAK